MIILKIIGWILLAVLGIIIVILALPVSAKVSFIGGKFTFMVKYAGIPVLGSGGRGLLNKLKKKKKKPKKPKKKPKKEDAPKEENAPDQNDAAEENSADDNEEKAEDVSANDTENADNTSNDAIDVDELLDDMEEEKPSKKKKRRKKDEDDPDDDLEPKEEKSIKDKIEFVLDIWGAAQRPLLRIFKGFKFSELYIDFIIAHEDAYKCALRYGSISAVLYNFLGVLGTLCDVKFKTVDINPGFALKKGRWDCAVKLSFAPITVVIAGIWFLVTYIFRFFIPNKLNQKRTKKSAARQK